MVMVARILIVGTVVGLIVFSVMSIRKHKAA